MAAGVGFVGAAGVGLASIGVCLDGWAATGVGLAG